LTSQPEDIRSNSNSIADKMERLFKVSRNRAFLGSVFGRPRPVSADQRRLVADLYCSLWFPVGKVNKIKAF
jgi:hypothetical protein